MLTLSPLKRSIIYQNLPVGKKGSLSFLTFLTFFNPKKRKLKKSNRRDHLPDDYKPFDYSKRLPTVSDEETSDDEHQMIGAFELPTIFDPEIYIEPEIKLTEQPLEQPKNGHFDRINMCGTKCDEDFQSVGRVKSLSADYEKMLDAIGHEKMYDPSAGYFTSSFWA